MFQCSPTRLGEWCLQLQHQLAKEDEWNESHLWRKPYDGLWTPSHCSRLCVSCSAAQVEKQLQVEENVNKASKKTLQTELDGLKAQEQKIQNYINEEGLVTEVTNAVVKNTTATKDNGKAAEEAAKKRIDALNKEKESVIDFNEAKRQLAEEEANDVGMTWEDAIAIEPHWTMAHIAVAMGLFPSEPAAPRVVVTNGMMIPNYSKPDDWERFNALGVTQYGQMTAGSYMYIGPQGIVHGTTITIMNAARKKFNTE